MGAEKWRLPLGESTLLQTIVGSLQRYAGAIVISSGQIEPARFGLTEVEFAADQNLSVGPLEGIRVGLKKLSDRFESAFVTACDIPVISIPVLKYLRSKLEDFDAVIPVNGNRVYGMTAVYRTAIHERIAELIRENHFRVRILAACLHAKTVDADELKRFDPQLLCLENLNTKDDYQRFLRRCISESR
jgi:molybdopterin-guanine dinucleotide biosynthesis protein A